MQWRVIGGEWLVRMRFSRQEILKIRDAAIRWLRKPVKVAGDLRASTAQGRRIVRVAEVCLWISAVASIGYCSVAYASAAVHQYRERRVLSAEEDSRASLANRDGSRVTNNSGWAAKSYGPLGIIEIPRLDISSVVEEGVDDATLLQAVGHIPGTAMPGENGNAALAAHRDTYFSGLGEIAVGDLVTFRSPSALYRYRVESTKIVDADATDALPRTSDARLTLVTCYPFHYVGAAPQRFLVIAREEVDVK
jgi:sortase A